MKKVLIPVGMLLAMIVSCNKKESNKNEIVTDVQLPEAKDFDTIIDGKKVGLYVLKNKTGLQAAFTNYGGRLVSLIISDKEGNLKDVVVGPGSVKSFINSTEPYYGATIGRYGNRIAKGKFSIDDKEYTLAVNNIPNTLHGGIKGFQAVVWDVVSSTEKSVVFSYLSKDGEEGYPGNLKVKVSFSITDNDEIKIDYEAYTDKKTVLNLTNHAFYNLNGSGEITGHSLKINADNFTPIDSTQIPTGKIESVANTPLDFRTETIIGARINADNEQIKFGRGYDHNFVLNKVKGEPLSLAATATGDKSGIRMDVYTEEPGMQLYTGNFMTGKNIIKGAGKDEYRTAFCLETQHYPDSPNQKSFPTTLLEPGKVYKSSTVYKFSVQK